MKIGSKVTMKRYNDIRGRVGTVVGLECPDGSPCVQVQWPWGTDWTYRAKLRTVKGYELV